MRRVLPLILLLAACSENLTPVEELPAYQGTPTPVLDCVPNLDGALTADELRVATDIPVNFRFNKNVPVDLTGLRDQVGVRVWTWDQPNVGDTLLSVAASTVSDKWYAAHFPDGQFVTGLDADGNNEAVYRMDEGGLWLLGLVSADENPAAGQTLIQYTEPVLVTPLPLKKGDTWISVGEVRNATFQGLPYAGRDVYEGKVDDEGELWLPDLRFENTLKVVTQVTSEPSVGQSASRVQVSWYFECFGEVARAVSADGVTEANFSTAAEVRRLGF